MSTHRGVHDAASVLPLWRHALDLTLGLSELLQLANRQQLDSLSDALDLVQHVALGLSVIDDEVELGALLEDLEQGGEEVGVGKHGG